MTPEDISEIIKAINGLFDKKQKTFLTATAVRSGLPASVKKKLDFIGKEKITPAETVKRLKPCLDGRFTVYRGYRNNTYIGLTRPPEFFLVEKLQRSKTEVTIGELTINLPLPKQAWQPIVNDLMSRGVIVCAFFKTDKNTPYLRLANAATDETDFLPNVPKTPAPEKKSPPNPALDRQAFREAYKTVGKGRSFVRIHQIREQLGWSRERFEQTLLDLLDNRFVRVNPGDNSALTAEEVENSFVGATGMLFITVTWLGDA